MLCIILRDWDTGFRGVLVAGSYLANSNSEMYNITSGEWSTTGQLTRRRVGVRMVILGDKILAMGGRKNDATVEKFNLRKMEWTPTEDMMEEREYHAVTGIPPSTVGIGQN